MQCAADVTFSTRSVAHGVQPGRIPEPADVRVVDDLASVFPLSELQACMVDIGKSGPTFMHWPCARLAGAKVDRL